ncbi:MAG: hypothetical protein ACRBC3_17560 [Burkholderiaceae bacterium]
MSGFMIFALGLIVGWVACKFMPSSDAGPAGEQAAAGAPPVFTPVTSQAPAPVASTAAAAEAQPTASRDAVSTELHAARGEINANKAEIKRLESELDAARRNLLAARHSASNHGSTIAALRDQASVLQRELKAALAAAKQ